MKKFLVGVVLTFSVALSGGTFAWAGDLYDLDLFRMCRAEGGDIATCREVSQIG